MFDEEWDDVDDYEGFLHRAVERLADLCFLSDNDYLPNAGDDYVLGYLDPEDWWPLVNQLDEAVDVETIVDLVEELDPLLRLPGMPTELLEAPLDFLQSILEGKLPLEPSGKRVNSRRLVRIALLMTQLLQAFPPTAQAAVRAWANVHRALIRPFPFDDFDEEDFTAFLDDADLPPAVTGFGMVLSMTLMHWPERADGMPLPQGLLDPELRDDLYAQWEALADDPAVTDAGAGQAEALFAQGQLAHALAQLGSVDELDPDHLEDGEVALAYSRLSRAILWLHHQCRHCSKREGIACLVASNWPDHPVPLVDVAGEIANTGSIGGCIRM